MHMVHRHTCRQNPHAHKMKKKMKMMIMIKQDSFGTMLLSLRYKRLLGHCGGSDALKLDF